MFILLTRIHAPSILIGKFSLTVSDLMGFGALDLVALVSNMAIVNLESISE
jgi:hypothetical protein